MANMKYNWICETLDLQSQAKPKHPSKTVSQHKLELYICSADIFFEARVMLQLLHHGDHMTYSSVKACSAASSDDSIFSPILSTCSRMVFFLSFLLPVIHRHTHTHAHTVSEGGNRCCSFPTHHLAADVSNVFTHTHTHTQMIFFIISQNKIIIK